MTENAHLTIVTGASRGLGRAIAGRLLAEPGHTVLAVARHPDPTLAELADAHGSQLISWTQDLARPGGAAKRLQAWLRAQDGSRYAGVALINNAALLTEPGPLERTADAAIARALSVGLDAALLLSAAFLRGTEGWPGERRLLAISSGLGRRAMAGSAVYCAVKAGLDHFSRALALEQAERPHGAKVVSLAPGVIDTDMQRQLRGADPARFGEQASFAGLHAQGRLDSPDEAARKVVDFLRRPDFGSQVVADVRG